jgi:5-methylcytosine-specific restriction protein A
LNVPSHPCRWPTCTAYVPTYGYCADHAGKATAVRREDRRHYDKHRRDPDAKRFYDSAAWQVARKLKLAEDPVCERCGAAWSRHVHHVKPLKPHPELRLDRRNLMAVCPPCHNEIEAEIAEHE